MYVKIKDGQVEKYPYSFNQLKLDNKNVSFPAEVNDAILAEWGVYPILKVDKPTTTYKQDLVESLPTFINGVWTQVWQVNELPLEQVALINEQLRSEAYRAESDPLFFKYQRGEVEKQVWLDKVAEIKARYA